MKIVVLASGGIDSTLMMYMFGKDGHEVFPLYIDYGHLAKEKEWDALMRVCDYLKLSPFRMEVTGLGKLPSGLTDSSLDIYDKAFLPTRNLTFITLGAAYCYSIDSNAVAIGLLSNPIFPDQSKEFIDNAEVSISTALGRKLKVIAPLIELDKRDVLNLAIKYELPNITYYCHAGKASPCGVCISCRERIAAEEAIQHKKS